MMIRSRPGFSPVITHDSPKAKPPAAARVNPDMQPAIMKHTSAAQGKVTSPLIGKEETAFAITPERMQQQAEAALKRMKAKSGSTEIIPNPTPRPPPIITSPHKD